MGKTKNYIVAYQLDNGTELYVSNLNMRSKEDKEIHLTPDMRVAKRFDITTAENIVIMNWWKNIGNSFVKII